MSDPTDKVVQLKVAPKGYSKHAVEMLEALLEKAKAGEIVEATTITISPSGECHHYWTGSDNLMVQLGFATRVQHIINGRMSGIFSGCD